MSRWFRHYAGMMRDEKLVSAAVKSKQPVERVVWVYGAILESASEIDDGGRYDFDAAEAAYFLRADETDICAVVDALTANGRLAQGIVVNWSDRQYQSDKSAARQAAYRERKRQANSHGDDNSGAGDVTPPSRDGHVTPQETETETDTEKTKETTDVVSLPSTDGTAAADGVGKGKYVVPDCPYQALVALYHEALPQCPKVEVLSVQRKSHLRARWRQVCVDEKLDAKKGLAWFKDFFEYVGESKFLTGRVTRKDNGRPFVASLDWLIGAEKFVKTFEGKYHE